MICRGLWGFWACGGEQCKRQCPVVRMGKLCIEVDPTSKIAFLSEELCIGCGICVKKCPMEAIAIINLPKNLERSTTHRYGANTFKLHRLPVPRTGQVLGLVGTNGIGKSTALKILAGKQKPNLGRFDSPPEWAEILAYFRGSELQGYFTRILEDNLKCIIKPQYVSLITFHLSARPFLPKLSPGKEPAHCRPRLRNTVCALFCHPLCHSQCHPAQPPPRPPPPPPPLSLLNHADNVQIRGPHPQGGQGHGAGNHRCQGRPDALQ